MIVRVFAKDGRLTFIGENVNVARWTNDDGSRRFYLESYDTDDYYFEEYEIGSFQVVDATGFVIYTESYPEKTE
jgi:hypothetical protein